MSILHQKIEAQIGINDSSFWNQNSVALIRFQDGIGARTKHGRYSVL